MNPLPWCSYDTRFIHIYHFSRSLHCNSALLMLLTLFALLVRHLSQLATLLTGTPLGVVLRFSHTSRGLAHFDRPPHLIPNIVIRLGGFLPDQ